MAATKAAFLITLLLLVFGSLALANPNTLQKPCPRNCVIADYMTCPPDNVKVDPICTNCCVLEGTGCQLYVDGKPICKQPRLAYNDFKLNQNE